jgi:nucleotide-binding universal stress UspA family protein
MYERILIVVDDASTSEPALQEGLALAKAHSAEVVLLGVLPLSGAPVSDLPVMGMVGYADFEPQAREDAQRRLQAAAEAANLAGVRQRALVGEGPDPVHSIAEAAQSLHCDLIVIGSEGRNAVMRLLTGSLIPGLITHAPVPVLVCRETSRGARLMDQANVDRPTARRRAGTGTAQT